MHLNNWKNAFAGDFPTIEVYRDENRLAGLLVVKGKKERWLTAFPE